MKKVTCNIKINHLTRVEGHGNILIKINQGQVEEARWDVVETPRFFEAILVGKKWENAPILCGRICGICSIGHTLASIRAVENAFGITPGPQVSRLRLLLKHMETLQSHVLHLFFLAAPDFLGTHSVIPLIESHPDIVKLAVRLKSIANDGADVIGGRHLHPTRTVVGGFTMFPEKTQLMQLKERLQESIADLLTGAELFQTFSLPDFSRETEYVSLKGAQNYPFIGGELVSTDKVVMREDEYLRMSNEYMVDHSTSKWSRLSRQSFAVGALARFNNNFSFLHQEAKDVAAGFSFTPVTHKPFMNNIAQLVECVHVVVDSIGLIDKIIEGEPEELRQKVKVKAGWGVGALEAPRGILYHAYEFDKEGRIVKADCVIPTSQNNANIHHDIGELALQYAAQGKSDQEITRLTEMLVRAYDPCISCSVH